MRDDDSQIVELAECTLVRPSLATIAGLIWIAGGCLVPFAAIFGLLTVFEFVAPWGGRAPQGFLVFHVGVMHIVITVSSLCMGVRTYRGKAHDTLRSSIGSVLLGLYTLAVSVALALTPVARFAEMAAGIALLAAGVLAFLDRKRYKAWRKARRRSKRCPEGSKRVPSP